MRTIPWQMAYERAGKVASWGHPRLAQGMLKLHLDQLFFNFA